MARLRTSISQKCYLASCQTPAPADLWVTLLSWSAERSLMERLTGLRSAQECFKDQISWRIPFAWTWCWLSSLISTSAVTWSLCSSVGRSLGGRQGFLNPTLHYISRLSMSHHLPCKAGTVTELADRTTILGIVVTLSKACFSFTLSHKGWLEKRPQGRSIQGRWRVWIVERQLLMPWALPLYHCDPMC